jgi:hypothetical protein
VRSIIFFFPVQASTQQIKDMKELNAGLSNRKRKCCAHTVLISFLSFLIQILDVSVFVYVPGFDRKEKKKLDSVTVLLFNS